MPVTDSLGTRMKDFYEQIPKTKLMRRTPVAIRIDGKAFHTFTKGFKKPFDVVLMQSMCETTKYLCENIQGCVLGYTQSDEITLILVDYQKLDTSAWFDYEVQKMCSIAASMATMAFNKYFGYNIGEYQRNHFENGTEFDRPYWERLISAAQKGAMFDARCFNIPREEVTNLIYWRQLDATRNSIQMVGQAYFSHKELHGKSCNDIQDMLMLQKGINWNDFPVYQKRGTCVSKQPTGEPDEQGNYRKEWVIDTNIPIFKGDDREYIEELIYFEE